MPHQESVCLTCQLRGGEGNFLCLFVHAVDLKADFVLLLQPGLSAVAWRVPV